IGSALRARPGVPLGEEAAPPSAPLAASKAAGAPVPPSESFGPTTNCAELGPGIVPIASRFEQITSTSLLAQGASRTTNDCNALDKIGGGIRFHLESGRPVNVVCRDGLFVLVREASV